MQQYGGNLSVQFHNVWPEATKPLMIIGQDECILNNTSFAMERGLLQVGKWPEGAGIMMSGYSKRKT
jgi:hypothetical protein